MRVLGHGYLVTPNSNEEKPKPADWLSQVLAMQFAESEHTIPSTIPIVITRSLTVSQLIKHTNAQFIYNKTMQREHSNMVIV